MSSSNIVKLDIGGIVFKTTKSTLTKYDGFFKTLLQTGVSVEKDQSGCIFIDRSPTHFYKILNFMRDEAQYYLLEGLIELCGGAPCGGKPSAPPKSAVSNGIRVVQTEEEMEQLRDKTKSLIFIRYSTRRTFRQEDLYYFPRNWNIARFFVQKHEARFDIFFMPTDSYASSYRMIFADSGKKLMGAKGVRRPNDDETPMFAEMEKHIEENSLN